MRRSILLAAIAAVVSGNSVALADWPVARHDAGRSGTSPGSSDISKPAPYWRAYLGGGPGSNQVFVGDVNGDGTEDVLIVAGGQVSLFRPDGTVIWRSSGPRVYGSIANVVDLDGDGHLDVIVTAPGRVAVLNGTTGVVEWTQPDSVGTLEVVRLGDVNADGHPDVWVDSCGCCAVENGSQGDVFSFAGGVANATVLMTPPAHPHCDAKIDTLGDWDGDGVLDFLVAGEDSITLFKADGTILGTSDPIGAHLSTARCEAVSIDDFTGDEAICFENEYYYGVGARGVFMVTYHHNETPAVKMVWNAQVSPLDGGEARAPASLYADLDGNGTPEVLVSGKVNGSFTTYVIDAATGATLASAPGVAAGTMPTGTGAGRLLLTTNDTQVTAYSFVGSPPGLNAAWTVDDRTVPFTVDWKLAETTADALIPTTVDLNADKQPDVLLTSNSEPRVLAAYDIAKGMPSLLGSYVLDPDVNVAALGVVQAGKPDRVFVSRNDGFLALLDAKLSVTNASKQGNDSIPGLRTAGYYINAGIGRGAVAGKVAAGDTKDSLFVVDSRGDLIKIDPTGASNVAPAKAAWRATDTAGAAIASGTGQIGCFRRRHPVTDTPNYVMATLDASGHEVASLPLSRPPTADVAPGNLLGNGAIAFAGLTVDANLGVDLVAMDASANKLWSQSFVAGAGVEPLSIADWNGDGIDDVAIAINAPQIYSGANGGILQQSAYAVSYFTPIVSDLDGDGLPDMTLQAGYQDAFALRHDLSTLLWQVGSGDLPYPFGAMADCGGSKVLIEGSYAKGAQLRLTVAGGANLGTTSTLVLASGASYPDEAAASAANATLGQLGDVAVSANLSGAGGDPTALVGSTDGYLYAIDACTGMLAWSLDMGGLVGSPIVADTDGDGLDEILVSVADGYLYALKNEVLQAPAFVNDIDPPHGITDMDVDSIDTVDALYAEWAPVAGATSYEVAVVGGSGTYLSTPSWIDVGNVTTTTIQPLPLVDGGMYFVGVRAVSPQGRSPDKASDGVVVHGGGTGGSGGAGGGTAGAGGSGMGGTPFGGGAGLGEAPILSGRACTCAIPAADTSLFDSSLGALLSAAGIAIARRRRRRRPRTDAS